MKSNPIPPEFPSWGSFTILADRNQSSMRGILEASLKANPPTGSNQQKIADFYESCMDTTAIDASAIKPIAADLGAIDKVTARHQRCYVAIEIAPLRRASGDLIGLRCVFLSSVIDIIALSLDPLSGQESVVIVDTADVKRGIRLATVTWASLNRVVSRNKGRLCRLPGH